jgi:hypothetical protein
MRKDILFLGMFGVNFLFILLNMAAFGWVFSVRFALFFGFILFLALGKILYEFPLNKKTSLIDKLILSVAIGLTISGAFMLIDSTEPIIWQFLLSSFILFCLACKIA